MAFERTEDDDFAKGEDAPEEFPEDQRHRRFSEGEETIPDPEPEEHKGRFSEGEEQLPEGDPEKHAERSFAEGQEGSPDDKD